MCEKTCCFTGHRQLPQSEIQSIYARLDLEISNLIQSGVTTFISGGALGFDQIAGCLIATRKKMGFAIKLILALPCHNQDNGWTDKQKELYQYLIQSADEVNYVSEYYSADCMKKRNYYMVDNSSFCICALLKTVSGTGQTVRYAKKNNLQIINVAKCCEIEK